jgi:outer membrane protein assembly factor BamB
MAFDSQWSPVTAPTPFGDSLYVAAGYDGNEAIAYDLATGTRRWSSYGQGAWILGAETPAVDSGHVYYYSGGYLDTFDRTTGQRTASIADPYFDFVNHDGGFANHYFVGGPMLGTNGNVIVLDSTGAPARLMKFTPAGDATPLGSGVYRAQPAFANGVVYAGGTYDGAARLDAVSEIDGAILWTWAPPADDLTPLAATSNIIATDTLIFVSTQSKLYAISATDPAHPVVWSAATPGDIAISRDNLLLVTTVLNGNPALVAYSLK